MPVLLRTRLRRSTQSAQGWARARLARRRSIRRIILLYWRRGANFGDDYLFETMRRHLALRHPSVAVVGSDLDLPGVWPNQTDLVIVCGGGIWGSDGRGRLAEGRLERWRRLPCPLVVAGLGIDSFHASAADEFRELVDLAALFGVRNRASWSVADELGCGDRVLWAADTSFLEPLQLARAPEPGLVGVNLRPPVAGVLGYDAGRVADSVRRAFGRVEATVLCRAGRQSDVEACRRIDPACPPTWRISLFERAELFVSARLHGFLLCAQNGVPCVPLVYSPKIMNNLADLGAAELAVPLDADDLAAELAAKAELARAPATQAKLAAGVAAARERMRRFLLRLAEVLDGWASAG